MFYNKKNYKLKKIKQSGSLLIELLIAITLMAIFIPPILSTYVSSSRGTSRREIIFEMTGLLQESKSAVKAVRESGWDNLPVNEGIYHPELNGNTWQLIAGDEIINGFSRIIEVEHVYRNSSGEIVETGGSLDPSTKKMIINLEHLESGYSKQMSFYVTRYMDNMSLINTSLNDFDTPGSIRDQVVITDINGGEIQIDLQAIGRGDWCRPSEYIVETLDLSHDGRAQAIKAHEGKAFTGTDWSNQGVFVELNISNDYPPVVSVEDEMTGYDTNDIYLDDRYAYVATDDLDKDVVIYDLETDQEVGYYNAPASLGTAQGIYVKDDVGYVTVGFFIHTFDLSSKTGSRPRLDDLFLWGTGRRLVVKDNYAYVAVDWGYTEMRIIDVSDPSRISTSGRVNVNGGYGREVYVNEAGDRAYLATTRTSSKKEFFVIDVSSKDGWRSIVGEYDSGDMNPKGVVVVPDDIAILVGTEGEEYQVVDLSDEQNPQRCGGFDVDEGIYGIDSVKEADDDAYSYVVTKDADEEFKIIEGGPRMQPTYQGYYISQPFDAGFQTFFNRMEIEATVPADTQLQYQVAIADAVANDCTNAVYEYVGPDGTADTYYTDLAVLPANDDGVGYENPGRCLSYKIELFTQDNQVTPTVSDVIVNYSP